MKKLFFIAAAVVMLAACQNKNAYTVSGTIAGAQDGDTVAVAVPQGRTLEKLALGVVKDGKYQIKGTTDTIQVVYLTVAGQPRLQLFLEAGNIKADINEGGENQAIGTLNNNRMEAFNSTLNGIFEGYGELNQRLQADDVTEEEIAEVRSKMEVMEKQYDEAVKNSLRENVDCDFGLFLLQRYSYNFEAEELAPILDEFVKKFPNNETVLRTKENNDKVLATAVGKKFIDFEMANMAGGTSKLSDFVKQNKVTLVDFWASWCGPCRQEMPNVKAAYEKFGAKGFGIVGVSLDRDEESWKKGVSDLGMAWPQISDLKYWDCEGAALYGVRAIPATVLINQEGTILARNLRGDALAEKLEEVLK